MVESSSSATIDNLEAQEQELWLNCALPAEKREEFLALDDALAAAAPPTGRKPAADELALLQEAKVACEAFLGELSSGMREELQLIVDLRKRARKHGRHLAEKREKKSRKADAKARAVAESSSGYNGSRVEPTALDCIPEPPPENPLQTPAIEASHVHQVYDSIADHWNHTRYKAWPRVDEFIRTIPHGSLVADLGCGNGKNIPTIKESGGYAIASDICAPLANIVAEAHGDVVLVADCLNSNLRSNVFDAAISIAVLHHLSTEPRRVQALREAARILKLGGLFLVYCWSHEQDDERSKSHHRFPTQDVLVPWSFRTPGVKKVDGKTCTKTADVALDAACDSQDWQKTPEVLQRYCHVYQDGELLALFAQVPELEVVDHWFDSGNWCAIGRRC